MINKKILFLALLVFFPLKALALIEVDITRGNLNPLPIAVSSLASNDKDKENLKKKIRYKRHWIRNIQNSRKQFKKIWFI